MQAAIQDSSQSEMADVSTTHLLSFSERGRSLVATGRHAGNGRPDAYTVLFGPGGREHLLLNMEVQESSYAA